MRARRLIAAVVLAAAVTSSAVPSSAGARVSCAEGAPCWNWRTMGNHQRGVTTLGGIFKIVGPRAYDRLNSACRIDWTTTPKLRGDGARCDVQDY